MRTLATLVAVFVCVLSASFGFGFATAGDPAPAGLPASLDAHYPPNANGPTYLMAMHAMSAPLSGFVSDLFEGDAENALANFERFRAEYTRVAALVPEWTGFFPTAPLEEASAAIGTGDPSKVMAAVQAIGASCHSCHAQHMPAAYLKYHWGDFSVVSVSDPVSQQTAPFAMFMHSIESDLTGVANDLAQGQKEAAAAHAQALESRFGALRESCAACHDSERAYFVDDAVLARVHDLQAAIGADPVDPGKVGEIVRAIGTESCRKCHLVHIPAAYAQHAATGR